MVFFFTVPSIKRKRINFRTFRERKKNWTEEIHRSLSLSLVLVLLLLHKESDSQSNKNNVLFRISEMCAREEHTVNNKLLQASQYFMLLFIFSYTFIVSFAQFSISYVIMFVIWIMLLWWKLMKCLSNNSVECILILPVKGSAFGGIAFLR